MRCDFFSLFLRGERENQIYINVLVRLSRFGTAFAVLENMDKNMFNQQAEKRSHKECNMTTNIGNTFSYRDIWVISEGGCPQNVNMEVIGEPDATGPVREYEISDFARYLLDPRPVEIEEELIGCEVFYQPPVSNKIKAGIRRLLPKRLHGRIQDKEVKTDKFTSPSQRKASRFDDKMLKNHVKKINTLLRPYDPTVKRMGALDLAQVSDITGVCEDIGGNRYQLNLKGELQDKVNYMLNSLFKKVKVNLKRAYVSEGLFEMRGYDFSSFDPLKQYRLVKFFKDGAPRYCVLNSRGQVEFWVEDGKTVFYMHLLEQSLQTNPKLKEAFVQCTKGNATPLKLFFNKQLEIDYSKTDLPRIYKKMFIVCNIGNEEKDIVMNSLNNLQRVVLFNYVPHAGYGEERLYTNISVMHDFRALEPLKSHLPQLYLEIYKLAPASDAGKFYLLDSMRGYGNGK